MQKEFAPILAAGPGQEDINRLMQKIVEKLASAEGGQKVNLNPDLLAPNYSPLYKAWLDVAEVLGAERPTCSPICGNTSSTAATASGESGSSRSTTKSSTAPRPPTTTTPSTNCGKRPRTRASGPRRLRRRGRKAKTLIKLRAELDKAWTPKLYLRRKSKDDLLKEMDSVVRVPGWANIWTQPIINRIDMLATGVRTTIGVKVFGNNLDQIQKVSEEVAEVLRSVPGAVDVFPDQNKGKGYLEIRPDRDRAARYGVNVGDIWDVVEVALGGKAITTTVEGRQRFPVRVRYGRSFRQDEEDVKNLLINAGSAHGGRNRGRRDGRGESGRGQARSAAVARQIPLSMVADVRIVEGPAMIKSENGMLRSYVQLNVRDRDIVGFVEEAQRVVAQKVKLPQGMYLAWSGEFENQVRAQRRC